MVEFERLGDGLDFIRAGAPAAVPCGGNKFRSERDDLRFLMLPGDELREFSSPGESWKQFAGRGGVVLVRDGRPVGHVITEMS